MTQMYWFAIKQNNQPKNQPTINSANFKDVLHLLTNIKNTPGTNTIATTNNNNMHNPESVLENYTHKLPWDFEIPTDH